jgi:hypothetical protein
MGSVEIERFENNLKALDVKKKEWVHFRKSHARALLEAHNEVLRAYYEALYAFQGPKTHHRHHATSDVYLYSRRAQAMTVRGANGSLQKGYLYGGWTDSPILENGGNVRLNSTNYLERKRRWHGLHKLTSNKQYGTGTRPSLILSNARKEMQWRYGGRLSHTGLYMLCGGDVFGGGVASCLISPWALHPMHGPMQRGSAR